MSSQPPAACPECGIFLPEAQRARHLATAHGHVELDGTLLPRVTALARLWGRAFAGQAEAHGLLRALLAPAGSEGDGAPYLAALEGELLRRADVLLADRRRVVQFLQGLEAGGAARRHFWQLLRANEPRLRLLVQELLLPEVAAQLQEPATTAETVRSWLDRLCPVDDVWEKLRLCRRLASFGAAVPALRECLRQLQAERPVACPQCGQPVPVAQLETHLRRAHQVHQYRGEARPAETTRAALVAAVCRRRPDPAAWDALQTWARDEHGDQADTFLAARLAEGLEALAKDDRADVLPGLAELLAEAGGPRLATALAANPGGAARQLALALADRLPAPLEGELFAALTPLLGDRGIPREQRVAGAATLLRTTGPSGRAARRVLAALVAGRGKAPAVERLRQLERLVGPLRAIDKLCARLEPQIRMSCPRCGVQLRLPEMARHVHQEHGLVLEGQRVREPWRLVEDLVADYRRRGAPETLARCRDLVQRFDPERGMQRLYRLLLAHGIEHAEARAALLAEAAQKEASLCPRCYALVPVPVETPPRPLNQSHGRLSLQGYTAEVTEAGLYCRLELTTPARVVYRGAEPGHRLTWRGAALAFSGPLVLLALVLALALTGGDRNALTPVLVVLGVAWAVYLLARYGWDEAAPPVDRAVDHAWERLAPQLHTAGFSPDDSAFLASLAVTSLQHGQAAVRAAPLRRAINLLEHALPERTAPVTHLAALRRLAVADAVAGGADPVVLVGEQLARCFTGALPLRYAERLLANWESAWWTRSNLARLRVLACDRAFGEGLEVKDLVEAGQAAPALGAVLHSEHPPGLAQLRLLWSQRPHRPWDRWGQAISVFEVAADPVLSASLLGQYPDLLLVERMQPSILLCGRGVVFQDSYFTEEPPGLSVRARRANDVDGFEVTGGGHRFWFPYDPIEIVTRLERWFGYYFRDFQPQVIGAYRWRAPGPPKLLRLEDAVTCPECRLSLWPRAGSVGLRAAEDATAAALREAEEMVISEGRR